MALYIEPKMRTLYSNHTGHLGSDLEVFEWYQQRTPYEDHTIIGIDYAKNNGDNSVYPRPITTLKDPSNRGDGGSTPYYDIPINATELCDLIKHKKMEHGIGEAFCALYRLNDNGEYLRNLQKVIYYITKEIKYYEEQQ